MFESQVDDSKGEIGSWCSRSEDDRHICPSCGATGAPQAKLVDDQNRQDDKDVRYDHHKENDADLVSA